MVYTDPLGYLFERRKKHDPCNTGDPGPHADDVEEFFSDLWQALIGGGGNGYSPSSPALFEYWYLNNGISVGGGEIGGDISYGGGGGGTESSYGLPDKNDIVLYASLKGIRDPDKSDPKEKKTLVERSHQIRTAFWNNSLTRFFVKDIYSIGFEAGQALGLGGGLYISVNIITRGNEAGIFFTQTPSTRAGFEGNFAPLTFSQGNFLGEVSALTRKQYLGTIYDISGSISPFGLGVWISTTNGKVRWVGTTTSYGLSFGVSAGKGTTIYGLPK